MIAWYWIVVAVLITNAITAFTYEVFEWENLWVNFISGLALIVLFVPFSIYHICFKNTIHPISPARLEELRKKWASDGRCKIHYWFGDLYFCTDPKASRIWNKVFFIRVK